MNEMQTLSEIEQGGFGMTKQATKETQGSWELELGAEGGLLIGASELGLYTGDYISLTIELSTGTRVQFSARVGCSARGASTGEVGVGIELIDLSAAERLEFRRWKAQISRERGASRVPVEVELRYRFRQFSPARPSWAVAWSCHWPGQSEPRAGSMGQCPGAP